VPVSFDSVPPPLTTTQVIPPGFLSFVTVAVNTTESAPSTIAEVALIDTPIAAGPPQPVINNAEITEKPKSTQPLRNIEPPCLMQIEIPTSYSPLDEKVNKDLSNYCYMNKHSFFATIFLAGFNLSSQGSCMAM
jgi:hypothetical protein